MASQRNVASALINGLRTNMLPSLPDSDISGKRGVVVSTKGLSNGQSDKWNDGSDYGPDTPLTETSGILEAILYAATGDVTKEVFLNEGVFLISGEINMASLHSLKLKGAGKEKTILRLSSSLTGTTTGNYFVAGFNNSTYQDCMLEISDLTFDFNNVSTSGSTGTYMFQITTQNGLNPIETISIHDVAFKNQAYSADGTTGGRSFGSVAGIKKNNFHLYNCDFYNLIGDVIGIDQCQSISVHSNYIQGIKVNPFLVSEVSSYVDIHDNVYYETNSGTGTSAGGRFFDIFFTGSNNAANSIKVHHNIVYGYPSHLFSAEDQNSGLTGNSIQADVEDNYFDSLQSGSSFYFVNSTADITKLRVRNNHGYNPQGFSVATPTLPAATGSADAVTNTFPFSVRIYQTGESGTHIIDASGNDVTLPSDPPDLALDPGCKIYYATTVATSWKWYGE